MFMLIAAGTGAAVQSEPSADTRTERPKGYHIVKRPERIGETPQEVKREKAEEDNNRRRRNTDIGDQSPPTREPELKPKQITP